MRMIFPAVLLFRLTTGYACDTIDVRKLTQQQHAFYRYGALDNFGEYNYCGRKWNIHIGVNQALTLRLIRKTAEINVYLPDHFSHTARSNNPVGEYSSLSYSDRCAFYYRGEESTCNVDSDCIETRIPNNNTKQPLVLRLSPMKNATVYDEADIAFETAVCTPISTATSHLTEFVVTAVVCVFLLVGGITLAYMLLKEKKKNSGTSHKLENQETPPPSGRVPPTARPPAAPPSTPGIEGQFSQPHIAEAIPHTYHYILPETLHHVTPAYEEPIAQQRPLYIEMI